MEINPSAVIHPSAVLGENVKIGPFSIIGPNVTIGDNTEIASSVRIDSGTFIGKNCRVFHGAYLGGEPQILDFTDVPSTLEIGEGSIIREYATLHRASEANKATRIGRGCMLMGYAHVGHDCQLGDHVVIANGAALSGHTIVGDHSFISGLVGIHQFVRIGKHSMLGGLSRVHQDVLPYSLVNGNPCRLIGINAVGLKRRNFKPEVAVALKKAIQFIKSPSLNTSQAVEKIKTEIEMNEDVEYLVKFITASSRGITK